MKNFFKITIPLAIIITLGAVIYQRSTGPTYPKKFRIGPSEERVLVKFPRSQGGTIDALVEIPVLSDQMSAGLTFKRFPTNDEWTTIPLLKEGNVMAARLPNQPPAGKLTYFVTVNAPWGVENLGSMDNPIIIRYKGEVPIWILGPHVFFMFLAMLLSNLSGLEAIKRTQSAVSVGRLAFASLFIGGMILGPIVQKYAFDVYWAGFPFDWDLTDNKLLIGVIFWAIAFFSNLKKPRYLTLVLAAIVLIGVYSIPHSMMGSQYNYEAGKIETDR